MSDDELRRRLQEIPSPAARIDADAVVAGARRRRRPKTIALSSAATAAAVLIVAPFVVPGLSPLRPTSDSAVLQDSSGAGAPESAPESGADGGSDGGAEESAAAPAAPERDGDEAALCGLRRAGELGIALERTEAADASAPVVVRAIGGEAVTVTVVGVTDAELVDGALRLEAEGSSVRVELAPGEQAELGVTTTAIDAGTCEPSTASDALPVAVVGVDGAEPSAVVGTPPE